MLIPVALLGVNAGAFGQNEKLLQLGERQLPLSEAVNDPEFRESMSNVLLDNLEKRACLLVVDLFGPNHPTVKSVDHQINEIKKLGFDIDRPQLEARLTDLFEQRQRLLEQENVDNKQIRENAAKISAVARQLAR